MAVKLLKIERKSVCVAFKLRIRTETDNPKGQSPIPASAAMVRSTMLVKGFNPGVGLLGPATHAKSELWIGANLVRTLTNQRAERRVAKPRSDYIYLHFNFYFEDVSILTGRNQYDSDQKSRRGEKNAESA
jgi:hypothetical protein